MVMRKRVSGPFGDRCDSLGWLVAVLSEEMGEALNVRLKAHRLSIGEWPTLFALWEHEGVTQTELSRACRTRNYTTSRVLDRLEQGGWVQRRNDPASRRNRLVVLSPEGRKRIKELVREADAVNQQVLAHLDPEQRRLLQDLLKRLVGCG